MSTTDQWSQADETEALDALHKGGLTRSEATECLPEVMLLATLQVFTPTEAADQYVAARSGKRKR